ncbi:putative RNA polymerase II transcriptional coactivator [Beauveria bassiana]|uniref:Transcriptional Coactivator p15 n=1 Tax=Beauveria bassiana (strain ARSEF 2860) TaxID=655819 RepID=J5JLQ9_BEAB2|nr:transcriptional Coactivator p15 [Beauveria bassiana ARSEF 2860]EJP64076.1 transcriptional Coactivator p15 [Beauveria bassiana ARSEF 2860]KAF1730409.1 putative RNA polymerase II transcriptional coactivator [Beauveria bassiana]
MGNKRRASVTEPSDANDVEVAHKAAKKSRPNASLVSPTGKDEEGNPFWEASFSSPVLSSKRRVGVSKFNNATMINIREYYEKDGKLLPAKKGISLSVEQYTTLIKVMPSINEQLRKMGQLVNAIGGAEEDAEAIAKKPKKERSDKANIEATSDEDEDED